MTKTRAQRFFRFILILLAILGFVFLTVVTMSKPAAQLGVVNGRLAACPNKPNCVNSQVADEKHAMDPLVFAVDPQAAWKTLRAVVGEMPRTTVVTEKDGYLHCEFRTATMRYIDDVEFALAADGTKIDFRSASRVGYSDMGANRKRMEEVRRRFEEALADEK